MTDAAKRDLEIDRLTTAVELLTNALTWQKQQNAVLRAEREQLRGALVQANMQMTQLMRFLHELRGQAFDLPTAAPHTVH